MIIIFHNLIRKFQCFTSIFYILFLLLPFFPFSIFIVFRLNAEVND